MWRDDWAHRRLAVILVYACYFLVGLSACRSQGPSLTPLTGSEGESWEPWQVLEVRTREPVQLYSWLDQLGTYDVIYLGEQHHNQFHIDAALTLLRALIAQGRHPTITIEMFAWDGQAGLDRYLTDPSVPREEFLEASRWQPNWGGSFDDYEGLIQFARDERLAVLAMNPPRSLVRQVARQGLVEARSDPEMRTWDMQDETIIDDPEYRKRIIGQLERCHGGGTELVYRRMYEASMFRDEGMAKTVVEALGRVGEDGGLSRAGPVVSYTGGGHVQFGLPVPSRVARRLHGEVRQVTVYLHAFQSGSSDEVRELLREGIADYVWLTPVGAEGPPRRCR